MATILAGIVCAPAGAAPAPPVNQKEWQNKISQQPRPSNGCFTAVYPSMAWQGASCAAAPTMPQPPRRGPRPFVIGNGDDIAARVPAGFLSTAIGSFDSAVNVTSESGPIGNSGPSVANAYTLQMNTNFFRGL